MRTARRVRNRIAFIPPPLSLPLRLRSGVGGDGGERARSGRGARTPPSLRRKRDALTLPSSPADAGEAYTVCADADLKLFAHCYGNSVTALLECIFIFAF